MVDQIPVRNSALQGHLQAGHFGSADTGVVIREIRNLLLWQIAVWPDSIGTVAAGAARDAGIDAVPGFGKASGSESLAMLRVEPLKFWLYGTAAGNHSAEDAVVLDLSHSRTHLRLGGPRATTVLNSFLPLDLRDDAMPVSSVASSSMHHVGVTLWRSAAGYELFVPRGFAVSIWELLYETSLQYGLTVE